MKYKSIAVELKNRLQKTREKAVADILEKDKEIALMSDSHKEKMQNLQTVVNKLNSPIKRSNTGKFSAISEDSDDDFSNKLSSSNGEITFNFY